MKYLNAAIFFLMVGSVGVVWEGYIGAGVAFFCFSGMLILASNEIVEELIKLNAKLDRIIPNSAERQDLP